MMELKMVIYPAEIILAACISFIAGSYITEFVVCWFLFNFDFMMFSSPSLPGI